MKLIHRCLQVSANTIFVEFKNLAQYRLNLMGQVVNLPIRLILVYFLWTTLFDNQAQSNVGGFNSTTIVLYFLYLAVIEFMLNPFCIVAYELYRDTRDGRIDLFFSKPLPYLQFHYFNKYGNLIMGYICFIIVTLITASFMDYSFTSILLSALALIIGSVILYALFAIIGTLAFKHENILTLRDNVWNIIKLLSGAIIPITFYPTPFRQIANLLPFRYIYSFPIELLLQTISDDYLIRYFCLSIGWMIALIIALKLLWTKSIAHHSSQGG